MSAVPLEFFLHSRGDTRRLGQLLARGLLPGDLILLEGPLGAGKTFLARAIARGLGVPAEVRVTSPTFDLVHDLPARVPLLHVDLYRLEVAGAVRELGLEERIGSDAVVLLEWGERFAAQLGWEGLCVSISPESDCRNCRLRPLGARGAELLERVRVSVGQGTIHGRSCRRV